MGRAGSYLLFAICYSLFSGCALFLPDLPPIIAELKGDAASICAKITGSGGGGALPIGPAPVVPGGGYGTAELSFCRTNQPGSAIMMNSDSMRIIHGIPGAQLILPEEVPTQ